MHVARHKSKVVCFHFNVVYKPGTKNPADYVSRNLVSSSDVSELEKEERGIQDNRKNIEQYN